MRHRVAMATVLVALALLGPAASAHACSCVALAPESRLKLSDAAVIARLVAVVPRGPRMADYRYRVRAGFKARRRFEPGQALVIRAARDSAACGLPGAVGRRFGLFLQRRSGRWMATLCDVVSPRMMRDAAAGRPGGRRAASC